MEQRNASLVRTYIGYDRLDTVEQTILLNPIYEKLWVYHWLDTVQGPPAWLMITRFVATYHRLTVANRSEGYINGPICTPLTLVLTP